MGPGSGRPLLPELLGESPEVTALRGQVERLLARVASHRGPPILIQGETGSGKGLLARQLHEAGRPGGPFEYASAHIGGVESELVVQPSSHSTQGNPRTIEEARRILRLPAGLTGP